MTKQLLFMLLACAYFSMPAQNLSEIALSNSNIDGVIYGEALWIDTTNDSAFELLITGAANNHGQYTILAEYEDGAFQIDTQNALLPLSNSSADKADFNNDGFMDVILTGNDSGVNKTLLYLNNGSGQYNLQSTTIAGASFGKIRATDLNNDDLVDVVVTGLMGSVYGAKLYYQNESGGFDEAAVSLMANYFGDITFIHANNDDYIDVLLTGFDTNYAPNSTLYINNNGTLEAADTQSVEPYYFTGTAVLDVDNDGDEDLIISGSNSSFSGEMATYLNDGTGIFTKNTSSMSSFDQVYFGDLHAVDINDDGYQDIFSTGQDSAGGYISKFYINDTTGNFVYNEDLSAAVEGVSISSCDWEDFDNDGDQDLLLIGFGNDGSEKSFVYTNEITLGTTSFTMNTFRLYPNPSSDYINIIGGTTPIKKIMIKNNLGQTILKTQGEEKINVSAFTKGVYFICIEISSEREQVIKFVKK